MSHLHHKVSALVDGELSPAARSRALAHAQACPQCRREIAETLEVKRRVHRLASVELSDDLLHIVGVAAPARSTCAAPVRPPLVRRAVVGVGSLSAVVIALAYIVGAPVPPEAQQVTPSVEEFAADFADGSGLSPLSDPVMAAVMSQPQTGYASPINLGVARATWPAPPVTPVPPGFGPTAASRSGDDSAAVRLLRKAISAPYRIAYRGMRVVRWLTARGVDLSRVSVTHVPGQGTKFHVPTSEGGSGAQWFVADADARQNGEGASTVAQLVADYDLSMGGSQAIGGRQASVISASQGGQILARFWIDEATGLLLRKAMYVDGQLVRWSGYTSLDTTHRPFMEHLPPQVQTAPTTTLSVSVAPALNDKGWTCPQWLTADFRLVALHQVDADSGVMRAEYTDGMSTVSVFEERGSLDASSLLGFRSETVSGHQVYLRDGLPMMAVWQSDNTVFTVVTDAPQQMMRLLLARFPRTVDPEPAGVTTRIGSGLARMAAAVLP